MDDNQISYINYYLYKIYEKKKENKRHQDVEMTEINKRDSYFYIKVTIAEMISTNKNNTYVNTFFPHLSPQQIFMQYLKGNSNMKKIREYFLKDNNKDIDLCDMICPHENKRIWYLEKDLIINCKLVVYCRMTLIDMRNMLKSCPLPKIKFFPAQYNIDEPEKFISIINNCDREEKKTFNFLPYLRESSQDSINKNMVYYLLENIALVSNKCFE